MENGVAPSVGGKMLSPMLPDAAPVAKVRGNK